MEKLTISRVGQTKDVQTKFGMKKKTGVQFKEYPEIWHDIWSGDLKEGQIVEGTRESRDYQGKTYWNFNFPKKNPGVNNETLERILATVTKINLRVENIYAEMARQPRTKEDIVRDYPEIPPEEIPDGEIPFN